MYIQPSIPPSAEEISLPKGYSGNAFRRSAFSGDGSATAERSPTSEDAPPYEATQAAPEGGARADAQEQAESSPLPQEAAQSGDTTFAEAQNEAESTPVMGHTEKQGKGLLGKLPFLSSLLPPPRTSGKRGGILPEWLLIGAVILLFFAEDEGSDILPLLLLLLLWD